MATEPVFRLNTFINTNPATGETLGEYSCATAAEVNAAVARARAAQPEWARRGVRERAAILRRFGQLLVENKERVVQTVTAEAGKPLTEALLTEVMVVLDSARFAAENGARVLRTEAVQHSNPIMRFKRGRLCWEPLGVIGIISPWNYPFSIPATEALAALVTGNTVVLKPSELTPNSALLLRELLLAAGVPRDVMQVVLGMGETGASLVGSAIDKLVFTGSVATGKRVGMAAAEKLTPVLLELGGKDAMVVLNDVDVDVASSAAVWGAMMNAGQTCLSVERCYVDRKIFQSFVDACLAKIAKLKVGNGMDLATDVGPMISGRQLAIVEQQVEDARAHGARVLCGGCRLPEIGENFFAPTLVVGVDPSMKLMREETFGPVLPVIPFNGDEEGIRLANDSEFGLAASVWTRNRERGERVATLLEAGTVMINDLITGFAIAEAPHGGVKASGNGGRTHGMLGLREMVRPKYVAEDRTPGMKKLWWYGYGESFNRQMLAFSEMLFAPRFLHRVRGAIGSTGALLRKRR